MPPKNCQSAQMIVIMIFIRFRTYGSKLSASSMSLSHSCFCVFRLVDVVGFKSQTRLRNGYPLDMILVYDPLSIAGAPGMYTGFQPPPPPPPPPQQQSAPFQHLQQQQQHLHRPHQPGGTPPQPVPPGLQPATGLPQAPFPMGGLQGGVPPPPPIPPTGIPSLDQMNPAISAAMMGGGGGGSSGGMAVPGLPQKEQEKLDLIMQVLSLSEESIAMLPEDQ
uniref:CSTF2_hinge domain-containing protein n=1 Tax=Mesocestoides corti TaxID=53468 RepID=A0A5K3FJ15_MESCO